MVRITCFRLANLRLGRERSSRKADSESYRRAGAIQINDVHVDDNAIAYLIDREPGGL